MDLEIYWNPIALPMDFHSLWFTSQSNPPATAREEVTSANENDMKHEIKENIFSHERLKISTCCLANGNGLLE
jgi:hypothetical protein